MATLVAIFAVAVAVVIAVYLSAPNLDGFVRRCSLRHKFSDEKQFVRTLPRTLDDAKALGRVLNRYKDKYYCTVLLGVVVTYIL